MIVIERVLSARLAEKMRMHPERCGNLGIEVKTVRRVRGAQYRCRRFPDKIMKGG